MTKNPNPNEFDQRLLDRMADGELDDDARRALLSSLDESFQDGHSENGETGAGQADGWRRLALAYVEAQTWGRDMKRLVAKPETETGADVLSNPMKLTGENVASESQSTQAPRSSTWKALAAGLVLAFGLGVGARHFVPRESDPFAPGAVQFAVDQQPPVESLLAGGPLDASTLPDDFAKSGSVEDQESTSSDSDFLATLVFEDPDGGAPRTVVAPLLPAELIDPSLRWDGDGPISSELAQALRKAGYNVQSTRRYAPVQLEDGRQMLAPIDDVKVTPVGYQVL